MTAPAIATPPAVKQRRLRTPARRPTYGAALRSARPVLALQRQPGGLDVDDLRDWAQPGRRAA